MLFFQLKFEGTVGNIPTYKGDIALDDIVVTPGKCPSPTTTPKPNPCALKCTDKTCISADKICDFVNDCGDSDNTDEKNCGSCDFENGKVIVCLFPKVYNAMQCNAINVNITLSYTQLRYRQSL